MTIPNANHPAAAVATSGGSAVVARPVVKLQEMDPAMLEFAISKATYAQENFMNESEIAHFLKTEMETAYGGGGGHGTWHVIVAKFGTMAEENHTGNVEEVQDEQDWQEEVPRQEGVEEPADNEDDWYEVDEDDANSGFSDAESNDGEDEPPKSDNLAVNQPAGEHEGCEHYKRRCKILAPCCGEWFWCRHCHNEAKMANERDYKKAHELDRTKIEEIECESCFHRQKPAAICEKCGIRFAEYYCDKCKFWDDKGVEKGAFHCDGCGICRVGGRENYKHCYGCAACYPPEVFENHHCLSAETMKNVCPVCQASLFESTIPAVVLRCGHGIHSTCLRELQRNAPTIVQAMRCPLCNKSTQEDMSGIWRVIDEEVARVRMPKEYRTTFVRLHCNDCESITPKVPFHIMGMKCGNCGSYNTQEEDRFTVEAPEGDDENDDEENPEQQQQ
ncbi:hypothetical protein FOZ61_006279 [Perkinsus olseni]|uniref:RING finger and CHY zinc finger domain-containing protein 1 n=1 Tax=Perkinsus olseni TaxID=32597 RepID=A0A7J6LE08_PEROL|nr:hypothetical protein FOZ61_006279 [Perkinsus olseni]